MRQTTQTLFFFFFNDTATTEIYTLSLHDALPIYHPLFAQAKGRGIRALAGHIESTDLTNDVNGGQIGRASGRERVEISVVAVSLKKKQNQRYGSSHIGATENDIDNVVIAGAAGVL